MKLTKKAMQEQYDYYLSNNANYQTALAEEVNNCQKCHERYGYYVADTQSTRNMVKALRMLPTMNTYSDWARLHVTEAALKAK